MNRIEVHELGSVAELLETIRAIEARNEADDYTRAVEASDAEIHADICHSLHELFKKKNERYGNSFSEQFEEFGMLSLIIRLTDKLNRLKTLYNSDLDHLDESIADTLADLANYAIMGLVELQKKK